MDEGYFVAESITRGALSRNYAAVGPSAARGTWVDIINFSVRKKAPVFAEIEPGAYYIGALPPVKKGDNSWKKPEELGSSKIETDIEKGLIIFEHREKTFELDIVGLLKRMAYEGFTKEFLAAAIVTYVHYDSEQKPGLNTVRRTDFPREKGIYLFEK
ncbi:MAG: hypothetical protein NTY83_00505 [Candidatus Micrarchaeota archaeon]|nr:hypothetical protein [Candidatus Micrarchaeota archaeon]